jgi:hypothetical protein
MPEDRALRLATRGTTVAGVNEQYLYDTKFYANTIDSVVSSARAVLPLVIDSAGVHSIVDVGCGLGVWLSVALELGVDDILGVDGPHVVLNLRIPSDRFLAHDLTRELRLDRRFDLAMSIEVAEHLDGVHARRFVADLVRLAPVVLFSAAIPGQGGAHHVNEQWQTYWVDLFSEHGYTAVDCIRPRFWEDPAVHYWYAQNMLLMVGEELAKTPKISALAAQRPGFPARVVHPAMFEARTDPAFVRQMAVLATMPRPLRDAAYRARAVFRRWKSDHR